MAKEIRVTAKTNRFSFDGQAGFLVLAGTPGTIAAMSLVKAGVSGRSGFPVYQQQLTVFWDAALSQDEGNREPSEVTQEWSETEVTPSEITYIGTADPNAPSPEAAMLTTVQGYLRTMIEAQLIVRAAWMDDLDALVERNS